MPSTNRYPSVTAHDDICQVYPDVFLLRGSIKLGPAARINRNMVIIRESNELTLINPVRMDDARLSQLDDLGCVKHIVRLGDFHGLDDRFYLNRYQCEFWAQANQKTYTLPIPTKLLAQDSELPFSGAELFEFKLTTHSEAAIIIKKHKLLITTDSIQYHDDWHYFSLPAKLVFRLLGFKKGVNIGPPWLKQVTPKGGSIKEDFDRLLQLDFDALISAHGVWLRAGAKRLLRDEVKGI
ncbi:hypothetical protein L1D55_08510 [Vibrio sp. Isolate22]|uniref:hypothetical protein n=1 Tax=Vibrio sp. Isolate22 TaxID=2908532 RepID=UPI001EFEBDBE|nr:hypothetical protein [Vibrio sp. Isolate22]MCG9691791.1 hypothetical protein [Vibrio sp. Isolate22]